MTDDARGIGAQQIVLHFRSVRRQHDQIGFKSLASLDQPGIDGAASDNFLDIPVGGVIARDLHQLDPRVLHDRAN